MSEDVLKELEDEYNQLDHDVTVDDDNQDDEAVEQDDNPPGFKTYDEWVAAGKDPDEYKGKKAYKAEYERIQEIRDLKNTMEQVVSAAGTWQEQQQQLMAQQVEDAKKEAIKELEQAKEAQDIDGALAAQKKIDELSKPKQPKQNPIITDFIKKNPIIDQSSEQFDRDFFDDMRLFQNGELDRLLDGDRSRQGELTETQIARATKNAFEKAKKLHSDKFVSPKNKRPSPSQPGKRQVQSQDTTLKLKSVKGSSRNPRDVSPANDIYELIKAKDPKAAETFAKNIVGE